MYGKNAGRALERGIALEGIGNCRELGGIPLCGGRMITPGRLYRSGRLSAMTDHDLQTLREKLHINAVIDLRNHDESDEYPNRRLPDAEAYAVPLFHAPLIGITREEFGDDPLSRAMLVARQMENGGARRLLTSLYPRMVTEPESVSGLAHFFRILVEHGDGALLWCCTSGKDRTGVAAALLLRLLGAAPDAILEDYLLTNNQTRNYRKNLCTALLRRGLDPECVKQMDILESVDGVYMKQCFQCIDERFGSFDRFVETQLLLSDEDRRSLLMKYTVKCEA